MFSAHDEPFLQQRIYFSYYYLIYLVISNYYNHGTIMYNINKTIFKLVGQMGAVITRKVNEVAKNINLATEADV